jgi:uncharacterized membrane protein YvbJ
MKIYCSNCGKEIVEKTHFCTACGNVIDKMAYNENLSLLKRKQKRLATLSIVFGITGIYPLLILGSIVGMILSTTGSKLKVTDYKKQLKIGFWISLISLILWILTFLVALLYPLVVALLEFFYY